MKKSSHPIDDFFRDALKDHEVKPSGEARSAFLAGASQQPVRRNRRWGWWGGAALGVLVCSVVGVILVTRTEPEGIKIQDSKYKIHDESDKLKTSGNIVQSSGTKTPTAEMTIPQIQSNIEHLTSNIRYQEAGSKKLEPSIQNPESSIPASPAGGQHPASSIQDTTSTIQYPAIDSLPIDNILLTDTAKLSPSSKEEKKIPYSPEPDDGKIHFSLGASYTPEWMFQTAEGEKYVNNFGLEGIFRFGRYSIRTGAGLSITKGTNEYLVEYNNYLGSYNKLDSMDFAWDSQHYYLLPTYYMSSENVWDSLVQSSYPTVEKRYTYLQIPMILGYDFLQRGRFALGLRAGPILSILLASKQLTPSYDPGLNQIVLINQISPDRIRMNWQVMGGISASLSATRRLSFELEPNVRYYFNSVYEKSDISTKPWSAGLRIAVVVKF